jgi:hypothetical protein
MSQENVAHVRNAISPWNRQDRDAALKCISPDAELDASGRVLNPEIYTGVDGFMRFRRDT